MLDVQFNGNVAVIDVRERILKGDHPKGEIINFIKEVTQGMIIEIHLPHRAEPLTAALESIGLSAITNEISPGHYRTMCVKL